jgi:hypothetical protein
MADVPISPPHPPAPAEQHPGEDVPKEQRIRMVNSELRPLKAELFQIELRELSGRAEPTDAERKSEVETIIDNFKKLKDKIKKEKASD